MTSTVTETKETQHNKAVTPHDSRAFLNRLTAATGGGMFLDGFVFAALAVSLAGGAIRADLGITDNPLWLGLISIATLLGTVVGGPTLGYLTDVVGRKIMFMIDLCIFIASSVAMFFVTEAWHVFALGILLGMAVGADYAIGSPLLAEFVGAKKRGHYLGLLEVMWNVGYVLSFLIGYLLLANFPQAWNIVLAGPAVPAVIILMLRHGLPESPRWLLSKGRNEEAQQIVEKMGNHFDGIDLQGEAEQKTKWSILFSRAYLSRTLFSAIFWMCIVLPYFALQFFQADVLTTIGLKDPLSTALLGTCVALAGASIGWLLLDRVGRRPILIIPMFMTGVFLALVAFNQVLNLGNVITVLCFFGYLLFYGVMSILPGVYPLEVLPTSVRASGMGFAAAASRVGAVIGTFLLPLSLVHLGLLPTMLMLAAVCFIGGVVSIFLAPETAGKDLTETGAISVVSPRSRRF